LAADPTPLAPVVAVSLTLSRTAPTVLLPLREVLRELRDVPRLFGDEERRCDEEDLDRELDVLRAFVFVLPLVPAPFLDVDLERPEALGRVVFVFACAIGSLRFTSLLRIPFRMSRAYPGRSW
jgi:hypothetical protein